LFRFRTSFTSIVIRRRPERDMPVDGSVSCLRKPYTGGPHYRISAASLRI